MRCLQLLGLIQMQKWEGFLSSGLAVHIGVRKGSPPLLLIRGVLLLVLNSKVRGLVPERSRGRVLFLIAGHALVL